MRRPLPLPSRRLAAVLACAAVAGATAGVATANRGGGAEPPPPKPLTAAVLDALTAPAPAGIVADVEVTNRLLPGTGPASALAGRHAGELHVARDGAFKLTLESDEGRAELTGDDRRVAFYDPASDTQYSLPVPRAAGDVPGAARIELLQGAMGALARSFDVSEAAPGEVAGRPAYTVRITPRDDGGLLGAAELSWDAERPVPLRLAVHARADEDPVIEVELTRIAYERVPATAVAPSPHPGAERVDVSSGRTPADAPSASRHGVRAVRAALDFDLAAPATLAGLPRRAVRLVRTAHGPGALSVYGSGLGALFVTQSPAGGPDPAGAGDDALAHVNIDGATGVEFANPLGTALQVRRGDVTYVVAGLVPPIVAERAARELR